MNTQEEADQFHEVDIYVPREDVRDSEMARISAWSDIQSTQGARAPIYLKVSSVQWNRSRGGWTICFSKREEPRAILRKKEEVLRELIHHQDVIRRERAGLNRYEIIEALNQRVWALEWVLQRRDCL